VGSKIWIPYKIWDELQWFENAAKLRELIRIRYASMKGEKI